MSTITHVRFFPSDWLAGTRGMTAAEMGVYITLIAMIYERAGPIDGRDNAKLARLCGTSASALKGILDRLISDGKLTEKDGFLSNRRAELEIKNVMSKSEVAREKSKARWTKSADISTHDECNGIAPAMLTSNQYPVTSKKEQKPSVLERAEKPAPKPRKPSSDDKVFDILTNALSDANARAIIEHRRAKGAKLTERAAELLVKEFFKVHSPDDAAETMIAQGWQGFNVEWYRRARPTGKVIEAGIN